MNTRDKHPMPRRGTVNGADMVMSGALSGSGPADITSRSCVLCGPDRDCDCRQVEFASPEYLRRTYAAHGMDTGTISACPDCGPRKRCVHESRGSAGGYFAVAGNTSHART